MKVTFRDTSATQYDSNAVLIDVANKSDSSCGKLWLGDRYSASFLQLKFRKCTHVVNCDKEIHSLSREEDITYLNIDPALQASTDLEQAFDFIETAINKGKNVTVLCQSGNSKSATVIAYYIMRKLLLNPFKSIDLLKSKHARIRINNELNSLICREAKKLGLMAVPTSNTSKYPAMSGIYFAVIIISFFVILYLSLSMMTQSPAKSTSSSASYTSKPSSSSARTTKKRSK